MPTNNLNRLVGYVINGCFILLAQSKDYCSRNQRDYLILTYEMCRSLGSLIYQNGCKLNDSNLNRLLAFNAKNNENLSLLLKLREKFENEHYGGAMKESSFNESLFELINRIDLITTQVVFNLTIPTIVRSNLVASAATTTAALQPNMQDARCLDYEYHYIDNRFKIKCCSILMRVIRFHHQNSELTLGEEKEKLTNKKLNEEFRVNKSKILTKALQGLENLFFSIKSSKEPQQQQSAQSSLNWLQASNEFQLGDILALVKVN
jgi:hypothetical protein